MKLGRALVVGALVVGPIAIVACGGAHAPAANAVPEKKCVDPGPMDGFDAGPDACWVQVDAAAFANKKVAGRLAPERIQAVVRGDFAKLKTCYERALAKDANVAGKVSVKFVIDEEGAVASAEVFEATLADPDAVLCMVQAYRGMRFPKPEGGRVTVVYPIVFQPGE